MFPCSHLPKIYQTFIMSATFNEDVQALKELVLHNPVRNGALDIGGGQGEDGLVLAWFTGFVLQIAHLELALALAQLWWPIACKKPPLAFFWLWDRQVSMLLLRR